MASFSLFFHFLLISVNPSALSDLQSAMKDVKGFEVSFKQKVTQELFPDSPTEATGSLMFTRPHHLHWTYEKPKKRVIRFDGKAITIDEGGEKQVIADHSRITLEKSFSFLWGQPDSSIFQVESINASTFRVIPRKKDETSFEYIDVRVNKGKVESAMVKDKLGSQSELIFSNWSFKK